MFAPSQFASVSDKSKGAQSTGRFTREQFAVWYSSWRAMHEDTTASGVRFISVNVALEDPKLVGRRVNSGSGPPKHGLKSEHDCVSLAGRICVPETQKGTWMPCEQHQTHKRATSGFRSSTTVSTASTPVTIPQAEPKASKPVTIPQAEPKASTPVTIPQAEPKSSKPDSPRRRSWAEVVMEYRPNYVAPTIVAEPPPKQRRGPQKTCQACGSCCLACQ
ncbi:MAG: uncharacterized protein KVP18_001617 [Porospora cf. gigantea A]|uniref:uncharacterized protein n=1 Tax=Porospora cf. gigantea A TaxID=2853593 RepID=UPI00355988AD|nr:MAG: hypothetical protein KVP18_001617 [Porospora cf. gigantea A]